MVSLSTHYFFFQSDTLKSKRSFEKMPFVKNTLAYIAPFFGFTDTLPSRVLYT